MDVAERSAVSPQIRSGPRLGLPGDRTEADRGSYTSNQHHLPLKLPRRMDNPTVVCRQAMRERLPAADSGAYLVVRRALGLRTAWPKLGAVVGCRAPGALLADYGCMFGKTDYVERWLQIAAGAAGLIVAADLAVHVRRAGAGEITAATAARPRVLLLSSRGLVALAECRIEITVETDRLPWVDLWIAPRRPGPVTAATWPAVAAERRSSC